MLLRVEGKTRIDAPKQLATLSSAVAGYPNRRLSRRDRRQRLEDLLSRDCQNYLRSRRCSESVPESPDRRGLRLSPCAPVYTLRTSIGVLSMAGFIKAEAH